MARLEALTALVHSQGLRIAELEARVNAWTQVSAPRKKLTIPQMRDDMKARSL